MSICPLVLACQMIRLTHRGWQFFSMQLARAPRACGQLSELRAPVLRKAADVELALALVADDHGALAEAAALEVRAVAQHAPAHHARVRDDLAGAPAHTCACPYGSLLHTAAAHTVCSPDDTAPPPSSAAAVACRRDPGALWHVQSV